MDCCTVLYPRPYVSFRGSCLRQDDGGWVCPLRSSCRQAGPPAADVGTVVVFLDQELVFWGVVFLLAHHWGVPRALPAPTSPVGVFRGALHPSNPGLSLGSGKLRFPPPVENKKAKMRAFWAFFVLYGVGKLCFPVRSACVGVLGLEPRLTEPESAGLPITPYPMGGFTKD